MSTLDWDPPSELVGQGKGSMGFPAGTGYRWTKTSGLHSCRASRRFWVGFSDPTKGLCVCSGGWCQARLVLSGGRCEPKPNRPPPPPARSSFSYFCWAPCGFGSTVRQHWCGFHQQHGEDWISTFHTQTLLSRAEFTAVGFRCRGFCTNTF